MPRQLTKYSKLLKEQKLQQRDVVAGTGISIVTVNRLSRGLIASGLGGNITIRTLKRFCQFHNKSPNDLLDWEKWTKK